MTEHDEAIYETETDRLPKQSVTRDGFRTLATKAGWHSENIDLLLKGPLPNKFIRCGDSAVLLIEEIEFAAAYEKQLVKP